MKIILVANTSWFLQNFQSPLIRELQSHGLEVIAAAPYDDSTPLLVMLGVRFIHVPMTRRGMNPIGEIGLLFRLCRLYKDERPSFVFHNTIKPVIFGSIAARLAGQKSVLNMIPGLGYVFIGGGFFRRLLRYVVKMMYRIALNNYCPVFFQNPDDKAIFVNNRIVKDNDAVITYGLGVDLDRFEFIEPSMRAGECTFLLVARMLWDKGVGDFVEAAKAVKRNNPKARFQLLGRVDMDNPSGIEKEKIEEWVRAGYVEYLGEVSDVRKIVAGADVMVLPSYYREGVPNSLMEAMAMGKPLITTNMPGCRETVIQGLNGILVQPRDIDEIVKAMEFMIKQPERRAEMGKESRKLAVQRFDVRRVNGMIVDAMNLPLRG